jgi:hypothetical protein
MEAAAWMPAEIIAENFRSIQRQVLTKGSNRLPVRSLEVCAFVERNIQGADKERLWPDLWRKWNAENPDKSYGDYRGFRQAYFRNMPKILQSYEPPKTKPSPKVEKRTQEIQERIARLLETLEDEG